MSANPVRAPEPRRLTVGGFALGGMVQQPDGRTLVRQTLERHQAAEHLRGARFGIAGQQSGQRVEHHQVHGLLAMQRLQAGDQGEPLGLGGTSALERPTHELDVWPQDELPIAGVPVRRGLLGDNQGPGWRNRQARQLAALGEAGQQVRREGRFARFRRADQGGHFARRQVTMPEPGHGKKE